MNEVEDIDKLKKRLSDAWGQLGSTRSALATIRDHRDRLKKRCEELEAILKVRELGFDIVLTKGDE